tara:strand:+ start:899 stop:1060 length:162 start_codon:yes stop_codon:yes gene_type:complete
MAWNWQLKNWPNFEYTSEVMLPYEKVFMQKSGMLYGSLMREVDVTLKNLFDQV